MITFVIYHVPIPNIKAKSRKDILPFRRKRIDYEQLLELTFRSAVLFHPDCRIVLLTSQDYEPALSLDIGNKLEVFRYDVDATEPMVGRTWAESQFLQEHDFLSPVVMLDGDMLINENLEDIFDEEFDIALTYNDGSCKVDKDMPINAGLKLVHSHRREAAVEFLQQVYQHCDSDNLSQYRKWWGDQYALIEAVGKTNFWDRVSDRIDVNGITVQLLSCDIYNFTPCKEASGYTVRWKDKKVVHFRGKRKRYMSVYWDLYLDPHENDHFVREINRNRISALLHLKSRLGLK